MDGSGSLTVRVIDALAGVDRAGWDQLALAACAARKAITSACAPPACWVEPLPSTRPSACPITQPTRGLGSDKPIASSASASASRSRTVSRALSGTAASPHYAGVASRAQALG
jgi:hypothetical protein